MLKRFLLWGAVGLFGQLIYSALRNALRSRSLNLTGEASLLLYPFFGVIAWVYPLLFSKIHHLQWWYRGCVYALTFFAVQFLAGMILEKIQVYPWHYSSKYSVHRHIYLPNFVLFFGCGLLIEKIWPWVLSLS